MYFVTISSAKKIFALLLGLTLSFGPMLSYAEESAQDSTTDLSASSRKTETIQLSAAQVFIEINGTDLDSGLHVFLDGEGWTQMSIIDPNGKKVTSLKGSGGIGKTGITEVHFEGAEPGFEELPLADFLARFPAGEYKFSGKTTDGKKIVGAAMLSHDLPATPVLLTPADNSEQDRNNTIVTWNPVPNPGSSVITNYEVLAVEDNTINPKVAFSAIVPSTVTSFKIPPEFLKPGKGYKCEVLAIEAGGNQTLAERAFRIKP